MKAILVLTDFSPLAHCSFQFATQLAEKSGASILLLHVVEHSSYHSISSTGEVLKDSMADVFTLKLIEKSRQKLAEVMAASKSPVVQTAAKVVIGNPAQLIVEVIAENNIDLVVMGSTGHNWVDRILVGSTTERVVRSASCPVITLKCSIASVSQLQTIVFAANLEEDQTSVVHELKQLQCMLGAHLHILIINTPGTFKSSKFLKERLKAFVESHQLENYTTHIYNDNHLEEGLFYFAEEINADILALAIHSRSSILNVLTPHSTQDIIDHAKKPVWTFNPKMAHPTIGAETSIQAQLSL